MKKAILLLVCLVTLGLQAKIITPNDAKHKIKHLAPTAKLAFTAKTNGTADLYVFNKSNKPGFVIVAAEDAVDNVILGYSDSGQFDADNIPENLRWLLSEYQKQIDWARANGYRTKSAQSPENANVVVGPLLGNTAWGQTEPFNNLCPIDDGGRSVTGCVATAMSQIIYYNKWPHRGIGRHTYGWNNQLVSVDFSKSEYEYDKMQAVYDTWTEESAYAVARLMYDCGVSVNMGYSSESSGTVSIYVVEALQKYFDYSTSVEYLSRGNFESSEWDNIIKSELDAHRVVYYSGTGDEGGHAFVCDGYNDNNYFHFNFGWKGVANGYYASSAINTEKYDFPRNHSIIIGIEPSNKHKIGELYYNIIDDKSVAVVAPPNHSEYSGDVIIPSKVTIGNKIYSVTEISAFAFYDTSITSVTIPASVVKIGEEAFANNQNLMSVTVGWTNEYVSYSANIFDDYTYNNAKLYVPKGSLTTYINTAPWFTFATIIDATGQKEQFTDWVPFSTGKGTYYYSIYFYGVDNDLNIMYRENMQGPNLCQYKICNWGLGVNLIISHDKSIGKYTVQQQPVNDVQNDFGDVYVSDYEILFERQPDGPAITFDEKTGLFTFNMVYFVNDGYFGYGDETFQLSDYPDFYVSVNAKTLTEQSDDTATQTLAFDWGKDIASVKYAVIEEKIESKVSLQQKITQILNGTIPAVVVLQEEKDSVVLTLTHEGSYTVIALGFDANEEYACNGYTSFEYISESKWMSLGEATYTDDIVCAMLRHEPVTYQVEVQTHSQRPGIYRLVNPYGAAYPLRQKINYDKSHDWYLAINAEDPDAVYITDQPLGVISSDGDIFTLSYGYYYMLQGISLDELKLEGILGTFKDDVITFPRNGILIGVGNDLYYSNENGAFRLDLSSVLNPDIISNVVATTPSLSGEYNLSGQTVNNSFKGIIIRNGKKYLKK
ncbi:MAG: C10 family peptidase [Bacteroidaceae bacterium]|nr:C10 family peptidase [Bacteroidaceae bacterium]